MAKGMEKGMEKGEIKKQLEIAQNMRNNNLPIETIEKCTGLSRDEIEELN